jgi:hypothetical protein
MEDREIVVKEEEQVELQDKLTAFMSKIKNTWSMSEKGHVAISASMAMLSTKHGMYANIPIICKGDSCPYAATCQILKNDLAPFGEPCPSEIAKIIKKYDDVCRELSITDEDEVDKMLLRDLINYEIMLDRCDSKVAQKADFIEIVPFAVGEDGTVLERPELDQAVVFREKIAKKKNETLQLLNSTRKDKAGQNMNVNLTPTQIVEELINKAKQFDDVVEVEYKGVEVEELKEAESNG